MARRGKPRKSVKREPNGRAQRGVPEERERLAPAAIKALLDADIRIVQSQEYGTACGRLMLEGKITTAMWSAARQWDRCARAYQTAVGAPSPDPKGVEIGASRGNPVDPDTHPGKRQAKRDGDAVDKFENAMAAVRGCGDLFLTSVRQICEGIGRPPVGFLELQRLRSGLGILVHMWGLTENPNSVRNSLSRRVPE